MDARDVSVLADDCDKGDGRNSNVFGQWGVESNGVGFAGNVGIPQDFLRRQKLIEGWPLLIQIDTDDFKAIFVMG